METAILDRIPPHNLDAEQAVLAAMMLDKDAIYEIVPILKEKDFYKEAHGIIYRTIVDLAEQGNLLT